MPIYRIEIDQPAVGEPLAVDGLPCHISAADPGHAIALLRSNIYVNSAGVPLKAIEDEMPAGTAVDWKTMLCTAEAFAEQQAILAARQAKRNATDAAENKPTAAS